MSEEIGRGGDRANQKNEAFNLNEKGEVK